MLPVGNRGPYPSSVADEIALAARSGVLPRIVMVCRPPDGKAAPLVLRLPATCRRR